MLTATPIRAPVRTRTLPGGLPALALAATLLSGLGLPRPAGADDAVPSGLTVQFPAALTTDTASRLRAAVYGPLKRYEADRKRGGKSRAASGCCATSTPRAGPTPPTTSAPAPISPR